MTTDENGKRIFHFYNRYHTGDNILNLRFFLYIAPVIKEKNYVIYYYYDTTWPFNTLSTLQSYIDPSLVILKSLNDTHSLCIELWMGNDINGIQYLSIEKYFNEHYAKILRIMNINDSTISTSLWIDAPYLLPLYDSMEDTYKDIDILILNSATYSNQCGDMSPLNNLAMHLSKRFKIVTANTVDDTIINATHLSLQQIAAISTHAKYIISTNTATSAACLNKQTKDNVKKWFFVASTSGSIYEYYSIDNQYVNAANVDPIKNYFDAL